MKKLILATLAALALTACGDKNYYTTNPEAEDVELRDTVMVYDTLVVNDTIETFDTTYHTIAVYDTIRTNDTVIVGVVVHDTTHVEDVVRDTLVVTDTVVVTDVFPIEDTTSADTLEWKLLGGMYSSLGEAIDQCELRGMRLATELEIDTLLYERAIPTVTDGYHHLYYIETSKTCSGSSCSYSPYTTITVDEGGADIVEGARFTLKYSYDCPAHTVCVKDN